MTEDEIRDAWLGDLSEEQYASSKQLAIEFHKKLQERKELDAIIERYERDKAKGLVDDYYTPNDIRDVIDILWGSDYLKN